jgi:LacI family transcriptional regulator
VAREASVGIGTVSRVLNNSRQVSPQTRERVLEAIQRLGFRPNQFARQLSRGTRIRSLGIISPFVADYSFMSRLQGVQRALQESELDYDLIFYYISSLNRFYQQLLTIIEQSTVEALLLVAIELSPEALALLEESGLIFVGISDHPVTDWLCIGADNVTGGALATEYLLKLGHRRVAYVGDAFPSPTGFSTSQKRYEGYQQALYKHSVPLNPDYVQLGEHDKEVAYELTMTLLHLSQPPTAIFCMSDIQALACLAAIRDAGLKVPQDISLIGFDDIEISALMGLTTVRQHLEEAGYLAMKLMLRLAEEPYVEQATLRKVVPLLPGFEVIERQTTQALSSA